MADETLDCKGLICPRPLFETLKRLKKMEMGKTIEVIGDYPFSKSEITEAMEKLGQEVVLVSEEGGIWQIVIRKRR
jgi:tRNA 2-thiouridine synthesizing protein A